MGCFKKYIKPVISDGIKEIRAVGTARAMSAAAVIVSALMTKISDGQVTVEERAELKALTKAQAGALAADILSEGLKISTGAAEMLVTAAVKAINDKGADPSELGVMDEEDESDAEATLG